MDNQWPVVNKARWPMENLLVDGGKAAFFLCKNCG